MRLNLAQSSTATHPRCPQATTLPGVAICRSTTGSSLRYDMALKISVYQNNSLDIYNM